MESCGMNFIKYMLFTFNLLFAISGIGIIVAGAVVLADVGDFYNVMESRILAPPVILIVAGAIVFLLAFLGCFGAIRESYSMLMAFAVGLLIIFILELAVGIAAACYNNDFQEGLKTSLKASIRNYTNVEADRETWDSVQQRYKCCGVDSFNDWQGQAMPETCCHEMREDNENLNGICQAHNKGKNYLNNVGCYGQVSMSVRSNANVLIGVGIGIAFVEVIGVCLACWLALTIKKGEK